MTSGPLSTLRTAVAEAARRLADEGLLIGTAGNVSARHGDRVAVTATGVVLADCSPDDVTVVTLDGTVVEGTLTPTSELELHLGTPRGGFVRFRPVERRGGTARRRWRERGRRERYAELRREPAKVLAPRRRGGLMAGGRADVDEPGTRWRRLVELWPRERSDT